MPERTQTTPKPLASFPVGADAEPTVIQSRGTEAISYRVVLADGSWVRFVVSPGGSFELMAANDVMVHVDELVSGDLRPVEEARPRKRG